MKRIIHIVLMLVVASMVNAYDFTVDGLYFDKSYTAGECSLVRNPAAPYSGSVSIPESVTYDGASFKVKSISAVAFYECENLVSVTIPNSIISIGEQAFWGCKSLTEILLPENLIYIGNQCFNGCAAIETIVFPGNLTDKIGGYVLGGCSALKRVILKNGITCIPDGMFADCPALESVSIPSTVKIIGNAFSGNAMLSELILPEGLTHLGQINGALKLSQLAIPESLLVFGGIPYCAGIYSIDLPSGITEIPSAAFAGCSSLAELNVDGKIKTIGSHAFAECSNLREIPSFGDVETVGSEAFWNCASISGLVFSDKLTELGENATFGNCKSLTSIELGNSVNAIPAQCFINCSSLTRFSVPDKCDIFGIKAFEGCSSLMTVDMPQSMTEWKQDDENIGSGGKTFYGCASLKSITVPDGIEYLPSNCFGLCASLETVALPSSLRRIMGYVFYESGLKNISLNEGLEIIGQQAFWNVDKLTELTIPGSVSELGFSFLQSESLKSLMLKDSDSPLVYSEIYSMPNLEKLYIGRNIPVGSSGLLFNAKDSPSLTSLTLGGTVEDVTGLFLERNDLNEIISKSPAPPAICNFKHEVYLTVAPQIDSTCGEEYRKADVWKEFYNFELVENLSGIDKISDSDCCLFDIYDLSGRLIKSNASDTSALPFGIYILKTASKTFKIKL